MASPTTNNFQLSEDGAITLIHGDPSQNCNPNNVLPNVTFGVNVTNLDGLVATAMVTIVPTPGKKQPFWHAQNLSVSEFYRAGDAIDVQIYACETDSMGQNDLLVYTIDNSGSSGGQIFSISTNQCLSSSQTAWCKSQYDCSDNQKISSGEVVLKTQQNPIYLNFESSDNVYTMKVRAKIQQI